MRKQDIQLRTLAKQGDRLARLKIGRLYLVGAEGIPRNISTGLSYLRSTSTPVGVDAARAICESLRLEEIIAHDQLDALSVSAQTDFHAQIGLATWLLLTGQHSSAIAVLERSTAARQSVLRAWREPQGLPRLCAALQAARSVYAMDVGAVVMAAVDGPLRQGNLAAVIEALTAAACQTDEMNDAVCSAVVQAVRLAEVQSHPLGDLSVAQIQASLERVAAQGEITACYILGRALCGLNCGVLPWQRLVDGMNLRKGSAMLLRAADSGIADAWLALYRTSADYRCSVANPQMARFCLEKAAHCGIAEGQRRLGALLMREASSLAATERALDLLFRAASKGDGHARTLLTSLVLKVEGEEREAFDIIDEVQSLDPWLGMRLRMARHFGLTKQEALSVDPVEGRRSWGLVVGHNPFISHIRLSSPRAIPALTPQALACAADAAALFSGQHPDHESLEGNLRKRSFNQRRLFERMNLRDEMFFAAATSSQRDALRIGSRWAHRSRLALRQALGETSG